MSSESNGEMAVEPNIVANTFSSLQANYAKAGGNVATLPPGVWTTLLQIATQLLQSFLGGSAGGLCPVPPTPAGVVNGAKGKSVGAYLFVRRHVSTQLREDYGFGAYLKYNGDAMVNSILTTAGNATPEEVAHLAAAI